jgi:hypothetical protein
MVPGITFEIFVAVEDIEDLNYHIGQIAGHDQYYELISNRGALLPAGGFDRVRMSRLPPPSTFFSA